MKNTVVRLLAGIALIAAGVAVAILHGMKLVPAGWESSRILQCLTLVWAYAGFFAGPILIILGLYALGVIEWLGKRVGLLD